MDDYQDTLTIKQFCAKYQISRAQIYKEVEAGRLPPFRKVGRKSLIEREDAVNWLKSLPRGAEAA